MPLYEFRCTQCGSHAEMLMTLALYEAAGKSLGCPKCLQPLERTFTKAPAGYVQPDFQAFKSPINNKPITSRRELDSHNRTHNVVHMHEKYTEKEIKGMTGHKETVSDRKELIADTVEAVEMVQQGYSPTIESEDVLNHG